MLVLVLIILIVLGQKLMPSRPYVGGFCICLGLFAFTCCRIIQIEYEYTNKLFISMTTDIILTLAVWLLNLPNLFLLWILIFTKWESTANPYTWGAPSIDNQFKDTYSHLINGKSSKKLGELNECEWQDLCKRDPFRLMILLNLVVPIVEVNPATQPFMLGFKIAKLKAWNEAAYSVITNQENFNLATMGYLREFLLINKDTKLSTILAATPDLTRVEWSKKLDLWFNSTIACPSHS